MSNPTVLNDFDRLVHEVMLASSKIVSDKRLVKISELEIAALLEDRWPEITSGFRVRMAQKKLASRGVISTRIKDSDRNMAVLGPDPQSTFEIYVVNLTEVPDLKPKRPRVNYHIEIEGVSAPPKVRKKK